MSTSNKFVISQFKFVKSLPQKIRTMDNVHMSNEVAEEIFRTQKINIKTLESKVAELNKQIKELKIENKTLHKANTLQQKELKKTSAGSTGISFLTQSHKEEIRVLQSKVSSLQEQLKISENNLKIQDKIVLRKSLQIENLTVAKKQHEKHVKEITLENKELKSEKDSLLKKYEELLKLKKELELKNEELQQKVKHMSSSISELEEKLRLTVNDRVQKEEDLNELKRLYNDLEQNFSLSRPCPTLVTAETQTDDVSSESNFHVASDFKVCSKKSEVDSAALLNAMGDCWNRDEYIKPKGVMQDGNTVLTTDSIGKAKLVGLHAYQNGLISHLPLPKIQSSLKPMKSRPLCSQTGDNGLDFFPINSTLIIDPIVSSSDLAPSSFFLQSNYPVEKARAIKYFSQKTC